MTCDATIDTAVSISLRDGSLRLAGDLVLAQGRVISGQLLALEGSVEKIDATSIGRIDSAGMALLARWLEARGLGGVPCEGPERAVRLLALLRRSSPGENRAQSKTGFLASLGRGVCAVLAGMRAVLVVVGAYSEAHWKAVRRPASVAWRDLPLLLQRCGADGTLIVILTNLLIGAVMGFLGVVQLQKFGADAFVPDMVAIGHLRELGPIMTAIIVAGRSGAGFAAELGTMNVSEECDALRCMGFDPLRWLVIPRELALLIALPLLTVIGMFFGLAGGGAAACAMSDLTAPYYIDATIAAAGFEQFAIGMSKSFVFAIAIAWISCAQGLAARGGAAAVGVRTTAAVVSSIFAVVAIDALFAMLTTMLGL